jgi:hypothetical protein
VLAGAVEAEPDGGGGEQWQRQQRGEDYARVVLGYGSA